MNLNRIQISIFKNLSKEKELEVDIYVKKHALEFIGVQRDCIEDLSEEEGDAWINKAYIISISGEEGIC
ncbi:hypothetical protein [Maridesulfovibrio bastinii]|uniref:hypothetical protein n=1 Tax=Maridesulfovibrio bastinii TaxID=47157 RepID=UPI00040B9F6C|nr:hypothetical protein [Maridesulfovibrio bastinii]